MHFLAILLLPFVLYGGMGRSVSYAKLTSPKEAKAFYRCGGKSHVGKRVHLHVPASRIHAKPAKIVPTSKGSTRYLFANQSVPLLVSPSNVYYRKIKQRTGPRDLVCVKGTVKGVPMTGGSGCVISVHTLKKAPQKGK